MYALADCNNFFASCERLFAPDLNGRPVVVLANNDGCIIARSNEAKALGLKMGDAYYQQETFLQRNNVAVFSSNLELYGSCKTLHNPYYGKKIVMLNIYSNLFDNQIEVTESRNNINSFVVAYKNPHQALNVDSATLYTFRMKCIDQPINNNKDIMSLIDFYFSENELIHSVNFIQDEFIEKINLMNTIK